MQGSGSCARVVSSRRQRRRGYLLWSRETRQGARMSDPPHGVWEERRHPLREEWVTIAAHRQDRPWSGGIIQPQAQDVPRYLPDCYLCPGNARVSGARNPDYQGTFAFDNDHPCVGPSAPAPDSLPPSYRAAGRRRGARRCGAMPGPSWPAVSSSSRQRAATGQGRCRPRPDPSRSPRQDQAGHAGPAASGRANATAQPTRPAARARHASLDPAQLMAGTHRLP